MQADIDKLAAESGAEQITNGDTGGTRGSQRDHEAKALKIGTVAVYSVLRDWIKGQITAVETGILTFEGAFLGQLMLPSGETVLERLRTDNLLPAPEGL